MNIIIVDVVQVYKVLIKNFYKANLVENQPFTFKGIIQIHTHNNIVAS